MGDRNLRENIFSIIHRSWPIHASGICRELGIKDSVSNISKVLYHMKKLEKQGEINVKKVDRALTAWPSEIERLRVIHELIK